MEVYSFILGFDAEHAGIIEVVRTFHVIEEVKCLRAELYKLDVYGAHRVSVREREHAVADHAPHPQAKTHSLRRM